MTIVCNNDPAYNLYVVSANRTQANSPSDAQYEKTFLICLWHVYYTSVD